MSAPINLQLRDYTEFFDGELPDVDLESVLIERFGTAPTRAIRSGQSNRTRPWLVAAAAAAAALVLFGGLSLLIRNNTDAPPVVDQVEPPVVDPAELEEPGAVEQTESEEPSGDIAELVETPWSIEDLPQGAEWGTVATPAGAANWVRLSADEAGLPAVGDVIPWPSGFAIFDDSQLWISDNGIEWRIQPLPLNPGQEAKLTFDNGVYWLIATDGQWSPATSGFWRSTDGVTWDVVDPQGLLPPGPTGFFWTESLEAPVTAGELTLSHAFYEWHVPLHDYLPVLIDDYDPDRDEGCRQLRKLAPGVFGIVRQQGDQDCPHQLALRFEETETGLRVLDNATGDELGEILGADLTHIDRLAQEGDAVIEPRLLLIQDNKITPMDLPWTERPFPTLFATQDAIYAFDTALVRVWRTTDGHTWTDLGPPSLIRTTVQRTERKSLPGSVVITFFDRSDVTNCASQGLRCTDFVVAWETTDGITWSQESLEGRPEPSYPVRLESGWFANDGPKRDNSEGDWWMAVDDTWVSLAELEIEGSILQTGTEHTTFFLSESTMWILNLNAGR